MFIYNISCFFIYLYSLLFLLVLFFLLSFSLFSLRIRYGYTMDTECIHLSKVSIYAACSCFGNLVFRRLVNHLATTWQPSGNQTATKRQPKKKPQLLAGANFSTIKQNQSCSFFRRSLLFTASRMAVTWICAQKR